MKEINTLLLLELRSFYGINKFIHTKDLKAKNRYKSISIVWIFLIGMIFTYVGGLVYGLCTLGLSDIVPAYLTVLSGALILMLSIFTSGNRIFGQRGYDILASLPVKASSIVISRFIGLYIADLAVTVAIFLPGTVVYGVCRHPSIAYYILTLIGTLFIPVIPLVISTLLGTAIMSVTSRMKNKSLMQSVLMVLLVIGIMMTSFSAENLTADFTTEQFLNLATIIGDILGKIYPPAIWLNTAMIQFNLLYLLLFIALSVAVMLITFLIVAKNFNTIMRSLFSFTAKHNYKIGKIKNRSLTKALYIREAKRYFASSIYVTNTIIGPILGAVMSVALAVVGLNTIENSIPLPIDIPNVLPFLFSAVFCMMTTTSVSLSMEGKQFWVVKSLPISTKSLLDSKILFNLSLMLPFFVISQIAFTVALKPDFIELLLQIAIPITIILFVTVFGITVNLKFHSFDWEKEETVVKQSLSAGLGGFIGFFVSIALGILVFFIPVEYSLLAKTGICLVVLLITYLLYKNNNRKSLVEL